MLEVFEMSQDEHSDDEKQRRDQQQPVLYGSFFAIVHTPPLPQG